MTATTPTELRLCLCFGDSEKGDGFTPRIDNKDKGARLVRRQMPKGNVLPSFPFDFPFYLQIRGGLLDPNYDL